MARGPTLSLDRLDRSLPQLLENAALRSAHRAFLRCDEGEQTFEQVLDDTRRLAGGLRELGVRQGDRVAVFMGNSLACVHTWLAANWLGATWVPLNSRMQGLALTNMMELVAPRVLIYDGSLSEVFLKALPGSNVAPIVCNEDQNRPVGVGALADLYTSPADGPRATPSGSSSAMLFTSGTTGRSKAAVLSHRYFVSQASIAIRDLGLGCDDVLYCPFPLFHADATALTVTPALLLGACAALGKRFTASGFWDEVRRFQATVFDFMGATLTILYKATPGPSDQDNPARLAWGVPVPEWAAEFEARFGVKILELYGSVEANIPATQRFDQARVPGSCGKVVPEFEVIVADDFDDPLPAGAVGELLVRPRVAFTTMTEYFNMPEETAAATRNFWFHTGDLARFDEDGNLYFVGRKKEVIRRRGENISAFEVEAAVLTHSGIVECAAVGVPSELTEEEILLFVVARPESRLTEQAVIQHCRDKLARFQVPHYVKFVEDLPHTPTGKIEKASLKEMGLTTGVWDAESEGRLH